MVRMVIRRHIERRARRPDGWLTALLAAVALSACCASGSIGLGRIADFLSGVLEVSLETSSSGYVTYALSGSLGGWADIPSLDEARLELDLSAATWADRFVDYDVDYDAVDEALRLLRAETGAAAGGELVFVSWSGDAYTADKGVCYLGWVGEDETVIAASYCGETTGAMYCSMNRGAQGKAECESCDETGDCAACDLTKSLEACLPPEESGASLDIDVDIDIDIDIDMDIDMDGSGDACSTGL